MTLSPPDLSAEPGWVPVPAPHELGFSRSFVSGDPQGQRLRVAYFLRSVDNTFVGKAWYGPEAEGPPGHAHGGSTAALLDEAMGSACWAKGHRVLAAHIEIDFRRPIPLGSVVTFETTVPEVDSARTARVLPSARLWLGDVLCASSTGIFVHLDPERMARLLNRASG
jgi:acyl-coenzyme A thioesterase PaaI-like protein